MTWPPTWDGPQWKQSRTATKKAKQKIRHRRVREEKDAKAESKRRDHYRCRFPRCGCRKLGLRLESSHREHKGLGGNPTGTRNTTENLMTVCAHRHKDGVISIDKGTLRWRPQTPAGADGPVAWEVNWSALVWKMTPAQERTLLPDDWRVLAIERAVQELGDLTDWQEEVLDELAGMEL